MYFATYKDSGNTFKDELGESLPEVIETLAKAIEVGIAKGEDISAGVYDLEKAGNERLIIHYYSSGLGDGYAALEKTRNITEDELLSARVGCIEDSEGFIVIRQWDNAN